MTVTTGENVWSILFDSTFARKSYSTPHTNGLHLLRFTLIHLFNTSTISGFKREYTQSLKNTHICSRIFYRF